MTDVYIVRHAEAEGNLFRRAHGAFNGQITELGKKQLPYLTKRFADVPLTNVYASDLSRAIITAQAIWGDRAREVTVVPQLREMDMGIWEDLTWGELQHSWHEQYYYFNRAPEKYHVEGAEYYTDVRHRMLNAVIGLAAENDGGAIAICSHGGAIGALLSAVRALPGNDGFGTVASDNTAVSLLQVENGVVRGVYANDIRHLPPDKTNFSRQNWWQSLDSMDSGDMRYETHDLSGQWKDIYDEIYADAAPFTAAGRGQETVSFAMKNDQPSGVVATAAGGPDAGLIRFFGLRAADRKNHLSVQLLGEAISILRRAGIFEARVQLSPEGDSALGSYFTYYGFVPRGAGVYTKDISI